MKANTGKKKSVFVVAVGVAVAAIIGSSVALFASQQSPPSSQTPPQGNDNNNKPMVMHIHPSITIVDSNGKQMPLPTDIGINPSLWKDHSLDQFGMQGMSPLHTHDSSGTVHVESNAKRDYSLGQFMDVWGGIDSSKIIKVTSDGIEVEDYVSHVFKDGERIIVEMAA
ncbi:MAG TPA: hypothetical protein VKA09_02570 [Nitrososphaeraceae archaeon]|jgi:hypothetical protein|nr:hypothetical protein [Nitrososphaeraceae archaeon]